jgi:type I restriction enzyme, S subunit
MLAAVSGGTGLGRQEVRGIPRRTSCVARASEWTVREDMTMETSELLLPPARHQFKPYPAYKESGVEWLGKIPSNWNVAPVYARYEVALGKMLDAKRVTGESSGRYLRNTDVQWDSVNTEALPEMDFAPRERDRYLVRAGDLLVCEGGEVGRTAIWRGEIAECFYQKALHRVRPLSDEQAPRFFYYLMHTLADRGVFAAGGNQNTIDHLTAVQLRHYRLPFASPDEQRTIVAFLDRETARIDGLVVKKERLIELLQEKRAALITRAVTKGLDPSVPTKDSGVEWLGQIPVHWRIQRLKFLVAERLTYGANEAAELTDPDLPRYIRITDIREDGSLRDDTFRSIPEDVAAPHLLSEGHLLFARSGATVGKTFRYNSTWGRAAHAGYLIRARLDEDRADSRFVLHFTQSKPYWGWLLSNFI